MIAFRFAIFLVFFTTKILSRSVEQNLFDDDDFSFEDESGVQKIEHLRKIYEKMDTNKDGFVEEDEIQVWVRRMLDHSLLKEVKNYWRALKVKNEAYITWDEFEKFYTGDDKDDENNLEQTLKVKKNKWQKADADKDGNLNAEEFAHFFFPHHYDHMADHSFEDTFHLMDTNGDGKITEIEYTGELKKGKISITDEGIEENRKRFRDNLDTNNNGLFDREEVKDWLDKMDEEREKREMHELFKELDLNHDKKISKEELFADPKKFSKSKLTDYEWAYSYHHEL